LTLTRYGLDVVLKMLLLGGIIIACTVLFVRVEVVKYGIVAVVGVFVLLVLNFFRDPERITPVDEHQVIAPADGRIVLVKEVFESEYLRRDVVQVSIFMSPLDVHVNRFPISGTIQFAKHIPGKFIAAFEDKSSEANERMLIGLEHASGNRVLFKQIAGAVARRIVADVTVGQRTLAGERFGMIKFGSRVDVLIPRDADIRVRLHDRVTAGETILATLPPKV